MGSLLQLGEAKRTVALLLPVNEQVKDDEALSDDLVHRVLCGLVDVADRQILIGMCEFRTADDDVPRYLQP